MAHFISVKIVLIGMILLCTPFIALCQLQVKVDTGLLEGTLDSNTGVRMFKGIPFAQPPVGNLRWKAPQPVKKWDGIRKAHAFGPRAVQLPIFGDMIFRSNGMNEDCLYLNVWTPAKSSEAKLPVLVYFYGGGFIAGDGSEGRYDGLGLAKKGIVTVTVNYRLGLFGFMAHPELTKEAPYHASGNYGLLDQNAAIKWVHKNIAAFGGDPDKITIGGESAGSISVSCQMASPLSRDLIAGAIGESGSVMGTLRAKPLAENEKTGLALASNLGLGDNPTLAQLRKMPADELLKVASGAGFIWFNPTLDGYVFPKNPTDIFKSGEQANVPLLAGINSQESGHEGVLGNVRPTLANYKKALERLYQDDSESVFAVYKATDDEESVKDAAQALAGDRFIGFSTWKWIDLSTKSGNKNTYFYQFCRPRPDKNHKPTSRGAVHAAEIEYALGNLGYNSVYGWTDDDHAISEMMQNYFVNFVKTGNPNGKGLPQWPTFDNNKMLQIDVNTKSESTKEFRARYDLLNTLPDDER